MRFGRLTVIKREDGATRTHLRWIVRCDCGVEKSVRAAHLRSDRVLSCGCLGRERTRERAKEMQALSSGFKGRKHTAESRARIGDAAKINLVGQRFGRLLVVHEYPFRARVGGRPVVWTCLCDCGRATNVAGNHLRSQKHPTRSCWDCGTREAGRATGQGNKGNTRAATVLHGHASRLDYNWCSPTYKTWSSMIQRCLNPNASNYYNYGGRGITVCDRWLVFENFLADMGERPPGTWIDRIDVNGHYTLENCRWVTPKESAANRRIAA